MKVTLLVLSALAVATSTLAADAKKHPGWHIPYEDEPLPIHELPECMQGCMDEKNGKLGFDIYTVPRSKFCRDRWDTYFTWATYHVRSCAKNACVTDKDGIGKRNVAWMYKLCGFPKESTVSGLNDWKSLQDDPRVELKKALVDDEGLEDN
ncbi:hypothetical protein LZ32DRAFT_691872 [Colletotrichum eremochloae]|nr:hypothetical protein LZ32DRAFT_691872 [Colletotrichum eremochloae]